MSLFGALVRTAVNVATLPVTVAVDAVAVMADASEGKMPAPRTRKLLRQIKEEANAD